MKDYTNKPRKPMMAGGMSGGMAPKATPKNVDMANARMGMMYGGKTKMAKGGMPMVEKDGKKVPAFAADGKGKMAMGGKTTKGKTKMAAGGKATKGKSKMAMGGKSTKGYAKGGRTAKK